MRARFDPCPECALQPVAIYARLEFLGRYEDYAQTKWVRQLMPCGHEVNRLYSEHQGNVTIVRYP